MNSKESGQKPDHHSYHEAMDRAFSVGTMLDTLLSDHPVIEAEPAACAAFNKAAHALSDLYQVAAAVACDPERRDPRKTLAAIRQILYPGGDSEHEWDAQTLDDIAAVINEEADCG